MSLALTGVGRTEGGVDRLAAIDLELPSGAFNVLLGPTGAGKTSLMRVMAGLDRPSAGRIALDGVDVTGRAPRERDAAMVYRRFVNYPAMTVYDNIATPLRLRRLAPAEIDGRVRETARLMGIGGQLDRLPADLSGDQQQRTAIARALVRNAGLLLLDEPLVDLDHGPREELRAELRDVFRQRDMIVVYATTEPREALLLGGRTIIMDGGRVLQSGTAVEVYRAPLSVRAGAIFSDPPMNLIDGVVSGGEALLGSDIRIPLAGHLDGLATGPYRFGVRANDLSVTRRSNAAVPIAAGVERVEINGSETFIHTRHSAVSWIVQEIGIHEFARGNPVSVFLDPARLFAFGADGALAAAPGGS